jgi:hypothetical protein
MNSLENLQTTKSLILPIFHYAMLIEYQYSDFIVPIPPGIYRVGDIYPCIQNNRKYYSQKALKNDQYVTTIVTDINAVTDTILDEGGNVILPAAVMKNKAQYLRNEPTVPSRGLMIVELLIKRYIDSISPWMKYSMYNSKILSHLKPDGVDLFNNGQLETVCDSLFMQLNDFIGRDVWHLYFTKFIGLDLLIEKTRDYRIMQWEEEHGHEYSR